MMRSLPQQALSLAALILLVACQNTTEGPKPPSQKPRARKRQPLFSFGDKEKNDRKNPSQLYMGKRAEELLVNRNNKAVRIGAALPEEPKIDDFKTPRDLLKALEDADAARRPKLLDQLRALKEKGVKAVQERREELVFLLDSYLSLQSRLSQKKTAKLSPEQRAVLALNRNPAEAFLEDRFKLALDRHLSGDYLGAGRLADALLVLAPTSSLAPKIKRLRKFSREHMIRETLLHTELIGPSIITSRQKLVLKLRLTNRSKDPIVIVPPAQSLGSLGSLEVGYETHFAQGTRSRDQTIVEITERKIISLKPGQRIDLDVKLPRIHRSPLRCVLGRYHIDGYLRPFELRRGNQQIPYLIPIFGFQVNVINRNDLALIRDPLGSFKDAVDSLDNLLQFLDPNKRAQRFKPAKAPKLSRVLRSCFLAAVLAGNRQRPKTLNYIERILPKAPPQVSLVLCSALSSLTGDPFQYSREEWMNWFAKGGHKALLRPERAKTVKEQR